MAVLTKVLTGKMNCNSKEIKLIEEILHDSGAQLSSQKLNELMLKLIRHLPTAAKQYQHSALQKLLLKKMNSGLLTIK